MVIVKIFIIIKFTIFKGLSQKNTTDKVMKLSDFNIIYLNLEKRPDRRIFIEKQLKVMKLLKGAVYFQAIDGETMPENQFRPIRERFKTLAKKEERIIGRIGCLTSHLEALKLAIDYGWDNVLILEDDCQFLTGAERISFSPPPDADVIYLGGLFWRQTPEPKAQTGEWVKIDRKHLKLACCLCYAIIGQEKMREIYEILTNVRPSAIDLLYINHIQKRGHCYVLNPVLCYQDHGFSSDVTSKNGSVPSFAKKQNSYFYLTEQHQEVTGR